MPTSLSPFRRFSILCALGLGMSSIASAQSSPKAKTLIHLFYLASGGQNWTVLGQVEMSGDANVGGAAGRFHQIVDLRNGRDVLTIDAGPIYQKQATLVDSSWQADRSGLATVCDTPSARVDAINESYQDRNGWFTAPDDALRFQRTRRHHGEKFDLVAVTPPGGRKMTLWLGVKDHLLYRIDELDSDHHKSDTLYSDYKRIGGVMMPFTMRQTNGSASQDTVLTVKTIRFSPVVDEAAFTPPSSTFKDAQLLSNKPVATVPFTIFGGNIVVEVSIDGHAAVPFLLDTGGSNYLTPQGAKALGVKGNGNLGIGGVGTAQAKGQFAQVKDLRLGPVEMRDQQFIVGPLPEMLVNRRKEAPIAGLVGAELLRRFPTTIDYQRKTLTFFRPGSLLPRPTAAQSLRLYFDGSHPYISLDVDGAPGVFIVDTGNSSETTLFGPFYRAHQFPVEQPAQAISQGGVGGFGSALDTRIGSLGLGPWKLNDPLVTLDFAKQGAFSNDALAGNLGYDFLKNFIFTLDYEHRTGYFMRSGEFGKASDYNRAGMALERKNGKVVVGRVNRDTPAEAAGIRVGDTILSVNGKASDDVPPDTLDDMFCKEAGARVDILYRRNGEEYRAVFQLKELLPLHGTMKPLTSSQMNK